MYIYNSSARSVSYIYIHDRWLSKSAILFKAIENTL
jgi:hypothetical protein